MNRWVKQAGEGKEQQANRFDLRAGECTVNSISRHVTKLVLFLFIMLSACAGQDRGRQNGDDLRAMQYAQIYDKSAALAPVTAPVPQDGQKAQIVIDTFWEVGRQQKQIHNAIDINVGN